jgi:hypothetical protein
MRALTQCWFTKAHVPESRRGHKEDDGSRSSYCVHCGRPILTWDSQRWFLADGFNVTRLLETASGRHLFLFDAADDLIVARFPVAHLNDEAALDAYKLELSEKHGVNLPGSNLELLDTGAPATKPARSRGAKAQPRRRNSGNGLSFQF